MEKWASILLRIGLGIMFAAHGAQKVFGIWGGPGMENFTKFVTSLGFPFPAFAAAFAAYVELIGGLCLLIGLGTRISSAPRKSSIQDRMHLPKYWQKLSSSELFPCSGLWTSMDKFHSGHRMKVLKLIQEF